MDWEMCLFYNWGCGKIPWPKYCDAFCELTDCILYKTMEEIETKLINKVYQTEVNPPS